MKASTKANEMNRSDTRAVRILAGAGNLRAMLWKPKDRWRVAILREDAMTGELSDLLTPEDIVSLAELTALIALTLNEHAKLDVGLSDDLGCLGHHLAKILGIKLESTEIVKKPTMQ